MRQRVQPAAEVLVLLAEPGGLPLEVEEAVEVAHRRTGPAGSSTSVDPTTRTVARSANVGRRGGFSARISSPKESSGPTGAGRVVDEVPSREGPLGGHAGLHGGSRFTRSLSL